MYQKVEEHVRMGKPEPKRPEDLLLDEENMDGTLCK
jgi:hypothetical protein